ncbi:MAG: AraC family transcriptional regulator [Luteibacter sp.]
MTSTPQERWYERMASAVALLDAQLDGPPSLDELARAAHLSPFHFHRIWRVLTGETVGETVVRLRIEAAQHGLRAASGNVTAVAMASGFATPQAFARAFRRQTGITPSGFARGEAPHGRTPPLADVRIVVRPPTEVVALRRVGADYVAMNEAYRQLWAWADVEGLLPALEGLYGIAVDDAASVGDGTARYDACLALGPTHPPAPFDRTLIAGGEYASITHRGDYAGLPNAELALAGWLVASGREPADAPLVHRFLNDPDSTPADEWLTEVLLPLEGRGGN